MYVICKLCNFQENIFFHSETMSVMNILYTTTVLANGNIKYRVLNIYSLCNAI